MNIKFYLIILILCLTGCSVDSAFWRATYYENPLFFSSAGKKYYGTTKETTGVILYLEGTRSCKPSESSEEIVPTNYRSAYKPNRFIVNVDDSPEFSAYANRYLTIFLEPGHHTVYIKTEYRCSYGSCPFSDYDSSSVATIEIDLKENEILRREYSKDCIWNY